MPVGSLEIQFDDLGLATVLDRNKLIVPPNQRSYSWEQTHVRTLFEDLSEAKSRDNPTYFLGTIALSQGADGYLEVADGQQRLATTAILIGAIRDYLFGTDDHGKRTATKYTSEFLLNYDERNDENMPKLRLNSIDSDFFSRTVLPAPNDPSRDDSLEATYTSHKRIKDSKDLAKAHVEKIVSQYPESRKKEILFEWIDFLKNGAVVIAIQTPDHIDAFSMFETLNDRGRKASQIDILKNYLFKISSDRMAEAEMHWGSMIAVIESIGDDSLVLNYCRHYWISQKGPTTESQLAKKIEENVTSRSSAIQFLVGLEQSAVSYTALLNPIHHERWQTLSRSSKAYMAILTRVLRIEQIRPLLLAITEKFDPPEIEKALRKFVSWSVRFLVAGGGGGGVLDRAYGLRAKEVSDGLITNAAQLSERMGEMVKPDDVFKTAFSTHSVSKSELARYYLRSLELHRTNDADPSMGGVDDPNYFNLEHILPQRPNSNWQWPPEMHRIYYKRIGNMALLNPTQNTTAANSDMREKADIYAESTSLLTQELANFDNWSPEIIDSRQRDLADRAVEIWKI